MWIAEWLVGRSAGLGIREEKSGGDRKDWVHKKSCAHFVHSFYELCVCRGVDVDKQNPSTGSPERSLCDAEDSATEMGVGKKRISCIMRIVRKTGFKL